MKKKIGKIKLNKETVNNLNEEDLRGLEGGFTITTGNCTTHWCHTSGDWSGWYWIGETPCLC